MIARCKHSAKQHKRARKDRNYKASGKAYERGVINVILDVL